MPSEGFCQACRGKRLVVVARGIDKQKKPCPYTHRHRGEWAKVDRGTCWVEKRWMRK